MRFPTGLTMLSPSWLKDRFPRRYTAPSKLENWKNKFINNKIVTIHFAVRSLEILWSHIWHHFVTKLSSNVPFRMCLAQERIARRLPRVARFKQPDPCPFIFVQRGTGPSDISSKLLCSMSIPILYSQLESAHDGNYFYLEGWVFAVRDIKWLAYYQYLEFNIFFSKYNSKKQTIFRFWAI